MSLQRSGPRYYGSDNEDELFAEEELFDEEDEDYEDYEECDDDGDDCDSAGAEEPQDDDASRKGVLSSIGGFLHRVARRANPAQEEQAMSKVLSDERQRRCNHHAADSTDAHDAYNASYQGSLAGRDHGGLHSAFGQRHPGSGGAHQGFVGHTERELDEERCKRRWRRSKRIDEEERGVFQKRSPWWVDGWRARSYVLRGSKLIYFDESKRLDRPLGVLDFALLPYEVHCCWREDGAHPKAKVEATDKVESSAASCAVVDGASAAPEQLPSRPGCGDMCGACCDFGEPEDSSTFFLKPKRFPTKVFAFRGASENVKKLAAKIADLASDVDEAVESINAISINAPKPSEKNFWRYPYVPEARFLEDVESGDLLLFRGTGRPHAVTRAITASWYDHVALLLRTSSDDVLILESTGSHGVATLPWAVFRERGWHLCYSRLVWRKVYFERTHERLQALQQFVQSVLGNDYDLDLGKIFQRKVSREFDEDGRDISSQRVLGTLKEEEQTDMGGRCRAFFCSELVAACLKRCGVLAGSRASTQYWPGTFSEGCYQSLPLHKGVHVGEEQQIVYEESGKRTGLLHGT